MRGRQIYFSKRQLLVFWVAIFGFLTVTTIGAFAQSPNLQIDPSSTQPPLCSFQLYARPRIDGPQSYCYNRSGSAIEYINGYLVSRYGGVPFTGVRPEYCYLDHLTLRPLELGSRGDSYCPPLDAMVSLSATSEKVEDGGKFSISWEAATAKSCTISGKAPETGNFSETFSGISVYRGTKNYDYVKRGIYSFQFKCDGYADNTKSTAKTTVTRNVTVFVGNIPPAPTVSLKVEPDNIKAGESATLSWKAENAIAVSVNQGVGVVAKEGSMKISPKFTTRYTITAAGEFAELGLARHSVSLRVTAPTVKPGEVAPPVDVPPDEVIKPITETKPEVGLLINGQKGPLTMGAPANITLSWKANQYCIAYGSWLGIKTKAATERRTLTSPGAYTYKLYCPGLGAEEIKVTVTGAGGSMVALPSAEASISLDNKEFKKSIHVIRGKATHLWLSAGYDVNGDGRVSRDADGGWSSSMTNGGTCDWNYDLNQGAAIFDVAIESPKSAKDCTIDLGEVTFYDQPGVYSYGALRLTQADGKVSSISSINIAVDAPPPPDSAPVIDLTVNGIKDRVTLGAPAEYSVVWSVRNADTCLASGDWSGERFLGGSQKFVASSKRDLSYTLTCTGKLGTTVANILVKVAELPVCEFSALPSTLDKSSVFERESVLSWKCQFANTCSIAPSTGVSTGTFGSVRVSPSLTTNYTLTCQNLDGSSSFDQLVELK